MTKIFDRHFPLEKIRSLTNRTFWVKIYQNFTKGEVCCLHRCSVQVFIALRFYTKLVRDLSSGLFPIYFHVGSVSICPACTEPFTRFQGLSPNEKKIPCHSLRT